MFRKNVAGQFLYFGLVNASTGAAVTGATVTAKRTIDGGSQASCTGTVNEPGLGQYELAMSQADTNGNNIGFLFTASGAVPVSISVVTTAANPSDSVRFGLTALPNVAAGANGGLPLGNASGQVAIAPSQIQIKKNTALANFEFPMYDSSGNLKTGLTITATRSIDGAAFGACANSATEVGSGFYTINLAAADLNGNVITLLFSASGAVPTGVTIVTQP